SKNSISTARCVFRCRGSPLKTFGNPADPRIQRFGSMDGESLGSQSSKELDQVVRRSNAATRGQDCCGLRGVERAITGERDSGGSHSGKSECSGSRVFLSRKGESVRTQTPCGTCRRGAGRFWGILQFLAR